MEQILRYFPTLTAPQVEQLRRLEALYADWNAKINVISRKDIQNLYEHHVLHSLAIAKVIRFKPGTRIMDLGTGGGFPGIPLAIVQPEAEFHLVDSIGKKVRVAEEVARAIGLTNVRCSHCRAEDVKEQYDFIVTRATMPLSSLMKCARKNIARRQHNALPNGFIALKGGELDAEIAPMKSLCTVWELSQWFSEPYFETKKALHVTVIN
jgi:16S rRNA (guanine527-N7)-methyltransferase